MGCAETVELIENLVGSRLAGPMELFIRSASDPPWKVAMLWGLGLGMQRYGGLHTGSNPDKYCTV